MDQDAREMTVKERIDEAFLRGKALGEQIAHGFRETEDDMDTWLVRWAKSDYSLGIAICFGLALLGIGALLGQAVTL